MYYPQHRPQLTGISTGSVDCGVRATQMGLDWVSKGKVIRGVKKIREIGGMGDGPTNYVEWDKVFDDLGGTTYGFRGVKTNDFVQARDWMGQGGAVIWAIHYGKARKVMPNKTGSLTFTGYHAVLTVGQRKRNKVTQWRYFDSLNDGRYKGCPNGPLWVTRNDVRVSAEEVGRRENGAPGVYALLLVPDADIGPIEPGPVEEGLQTLPDLHADLLEIAARTSDPTAAEDILAEAEDLGLLLGLSGNPEADENTDVNDGIKV